MFENLSEFVPTILDGLLLTVVATLGGIALATVLSFVAGLAMLSRLTVVRIVARTYVEIWRGTSELVQLFWIFFALPILTGFQIIPLGAGIVVLGLNFGAYGGEIVRGAVQSVPKEQYEGCIALNLTTAQRMRRVVLPQALVEMVPPFNNLFIQLLKGSALLTFIGVHEMTYQGKEVLAQSNPVNEMGLIYTIVLFFYLLLSILITAAMKVLERWAAATVGRTPPSRTAVLAKAGGGAGVA